MAAKQRAVVELEGLEVAVGDRDHPLTRRTLGFGQVGKHQRARCDISLDAWERAEFHRAADNSLDLGDLARRNREPKGHDRGVSVLFHQAEPGDLAGFGIGCLEIVAATPGADRVPQPVTGLEPDGGKIGWGHQASVGYLPQDHHGVVRKGTTCFGWLRDLHDKLTNEEISGVLGRMLFSGEERMKNTDTLSGGETVRLLLAKLMITQPNVLLLDEPTNHLDLEAIRSLTLGLASFEGTIVFVTHDRQMVSRVATRVIEMSAEGVRELSTHQFDDGQFLLGHGRKKSA